jgi:type I restriction enzyme R subunit
VPDEDEAMTTDTSERGLERLICTALAGHPCDPVRENEIKKPATTYGGVGWIGGYSRDYDREYCVDLAQLTVFLRATQPEAAESLALDEDGPTRRKFLARLQGEISKRGAGPFPAQPRAPQEARCLRTRFHE